MTPGANMVEVVRWEEYVAKAVRCGEVGFVYRAEARIRSNKDDGSRKRAHARYAWHQRQVGRYAIFKAAIQ